MDDLLFSPDSRRLSYVATNGGTKRVILDATEGPAIDEIAFGAPRYFSPNSARFAYGAVRGTDQRVIIDGQEGRPYDTLGALGFFSPDSRRVAYWAKRAGQWFAVTDGVESPGYEAPNGFLSFRFSPDGRRIAYQAKKAGRWIIVRDGTEIRHADHLGDPVWSPDSSKIAYDVQGTSARVAVNGQEEKLTWDQTHSIKFSSDSRKVAYIARRGVKQHAVFAGQVGPAVDEIDVTEFHVKPDSSGIVYGAKLGGRAAVFDGTTRGPAYDEIGSLRVSPNSKRVAYFGRRGQSWVAVVDGRAEKAYDAVFPYSLSFSPDSRHVVYFARDGEERIVVVNSVEGPKYQRLAALFPGTSIVSEIFAHPIFDGPDRFHSIGIRGAIVYRFVVLVK